MADTPLLLDINQAADHTSQPVTALRRAVRANQLRHIRQGFGGKLWFKPEWLHAWIDSLEATDGEATSA